MFYRQTALEGFGYALAKRLGIDIEFVSTGKRPCTDGRTVWCPVIRGKEYNEGEWQVGIGTLYHESAHCLFETVPWFENYCNVLHKGCSVHRDAANCIIDIADESRMEVLDSHQGLRHSRSSLRMSNAYEHMHCLMDGKYNPGNADLMFQAQVLVIMHLRGGVQPALNKAHWAAMKEVSDGIIAAMDNQNIPPPPGMTAGRPMSYLIGIAKMARTTKATRKLLRTPQQWKKLTALADELAEFFLLFIDTSNRQSQSKDAGNSSPGQQGQQQQGQQGNGGQGSGQPSSDPSESNGGGSGQQGPPQTPFNDKLGDGGKQEKDDGEEEAGRADGAEAGGEDPADACDPTGAGQGGGVGDDDEEGDTTVLYHRRDPIGGNATAPVDWKPTAGCWFNGYLHAEIVAPMQSFAERLAESYRAEGLIGEHHNGAGLTSPCRAATDWKVFGRMDEDIGEFCAVACCLDWSYSMREHISGTGQGIYNTSASSQSHECVGAYCSAAAEAFCQAIESIGEVQRWRYSSNAHEVDTFNDNTSPDGGTSTGRCMEKAIEWLKDVDTDRKVLCVLTDGAPGDAADVEEQCGIAQSYGITIVAFGIAKDTDAIEETMPGAIFVPVDDPNELACYLFGTVAATVMSA